MIQIQDYSDNYRDRWSEYVANSPHSTIAHQIEWGEIMRKGLGHPPRYLMALDGETIKGILPMVLVKTMWRSTYLVSLPWIDYGGVCADNPEIEKALIDRACSIAEEEKAKFIELRSVNPIDHDLPVKEDKATFLLKLDKNPEIILKSFGAKLRNQIRKPWKSGLTVEIGGIELLNDFYKIFSWKMRDLGTPVWGIIFFKSILEQLPDSAKIVMVKREGDPVATGLLLSFKNRLYVPSAASYNSALRYCPNHALYWEVIKKGCLEDYQYFDFGRSALDSNTYRFKKQWVPDPTPLVWQYHLRGTNSLPSINPSNPKYRLFISLWRKLPLPVANYLGPKVIRNFP